MALHLVNKTLPSLMHPGRFAHNEKLPEVGLYQRLAHGQNFVACQQKKLLFIRAQNFYSPTTPSSAAIKIWPFAFRTGATTTSLDLIFGATFTDFGAVSPPEVSFICKRISDGVTVDTSNVTYWAENAGGTIGPSDMSHKRTHLEGLAPDTEYWLDISATNGMLLAYLTVHETQVRHADDTVTGLTNPGAFVADGPIYKSHISDLVDSSQRLWKQCGTQLLSWSCDYEEANTTVPTTASTSYGNLISNSPAAYLATQYHDRYMGGGSVPVRMAVRAKRTAGTGTGSVRLYDGTNSLEIAAMVLTSNFAWYTMSGSISSTPASWNIQGLVSVGTTTMAVSSVCVWEYST